MNFRKYGVFVYAYSCSSGFSQLSWCYGDIAALLTTTSRSKYSTNECKHAKSVYHLVVNVQYAI